MKPTGGLCIGAREVPATRGTLLALNPATNINIKPEFALGGALRMSTVARSRLIDGERFTIADPVLGAFAKRWFGLPGIRCQSIPDLERWYQRLATRTGFKKYVDLELT